MIRRITASILTTLAVGVLLMLLVSFWTPIQFTLGSYDDLPITHFHCERGFVQMTRRSHGATVSPVTGGAGSMIGFHWATLPIIRGGIQSSRMRFLPDDQILILTCIESNTGLRLDLLELPIPKKDDVPFTLTGLIVLAGLRGWPWLVPVLLMIWPVLMIHHGPYRRYRRRRKGLCLTCGYNLTGNVSGICPECGERV